MTEALATWTLARLGELSEALPGMGAEYRGGSSGSLG